MLYPFVTYLSNFYTDTVAKAAVLHQLESVLPSKQNLTASYDISPPKHALTASAEKRQQEWEDREEKEWKAAHQKSVSGDDEDEVCKANVLWMYVQSVLEMCLLYIHSFECVIGSCCCFTAGQTLEVSSYNSLDCEKYVIIIYIVFQWSLYTYLIPLLFYT